MKRRLSFTEIEITRITTALTEYRLKRSKAFLKCFDQGLTGEAKRLRAECLELEELTARLIDIDFNIQPTESTDAKADK